MTNQQQLAARILANTGVDLPADPGAGLEPDQLYLANESRFNETYFSEPLTAYAVDWRDPRNIEETIEFISPGVQVPRRFTYDEFTNIEEFLSETEDDHREIMGDFKRIQPFTNKKVEAKTVNRGLTLRVDLDDEVGDWRTKKTGKILRRLRRNSLRRGFALLSAAAVNTAFTWDTSAGKDPDKDIETRLIAAEDVSGIRPNRVLYGDTAWDKRRLSHRAQDNAGGYASAGLRPEEVAGYLMVDGAHVSRQRYQSSAAAKAQIVNNLVLMFYAEPGVDQEDFSNIKRFWTPTDTGTEVRVFEQQVSAKLIDITVELYELHKIVSTLGIQKGTIS